jgi:hypothetical protein
LLLHETQGLPFYLQQIPHMENMIQLRISQRM